MQPFESIPVRASKCFFGIFHSLASGIPVRKRLRSCLSGSPLFQTKILRYSKGACVSMRTCKPNQPVQSASANMAVITKHINGGPRGQRKRQNGRAEFML